MVLTEQQAFEEIEKTRKAVNRFKFERLIEPLMYGVARTDEQKTLTAETIYNFFHDGGAGYYIKEIVLKTIYRNNKDGSETKIRSWLDKDGKELTWCEMENLQYCIYN